MIRSILQIGDPALRERSVEIDPAAIAGAATQALIDDLIETMRAHDGAGIAAPQVGVLERVCIVEVRTDQERYRGHPEIPLTVLINPTVEMLGDETFENFEGCLSVPGRRGKVRRAAGIRSHALDRAGRPFEREYWGVRSGVFQHELDHLDGILFVDRADPDSIWPLDVFEERFRPGYAKHIAAIGARYR